MASASLVLLSGCGFLIVHGVRHAYNEYTRQVREVDAALARYGTYVLHMQPEKVAEMFDSSGEISQDDQAPVLGRSAILALLHSRSGCKVLEYAVTATSTTVNGTNATQSGSYRQKVVAPSGETVVANGTFEAQWSYQRDGQWLFTHLHTAAGGPGHGVPKKLREGSVSP